MVVYLIDCLSPVVSRIHSTELYNTHCSTAAAHVKEEHQTLLPGEAVIHRIPKSHLQHP